LPDNNYPKILKQILSNEKSSLDYAHEQDLSGGKAEGIPVESIEGTTAISAEKIEKL